MSRQTSNKSSRSRPSTLSTKSFTRFEPSATSPPSTRSRASTVQSSSSTKPSIQHELVQEDVFEKPNLEEEEVVSPALPRSQSLPDAFDELPIELASLTDRFVDSLSLKLYNEPPTVEQLSELFQEFYLRASSNISIHISALISRLNRESSPTPSKSSAKSRNLALEKSEDLLTPTDKSKGAQQMLTASEVTEKRKARKVLEYKRILLEEAVERRACERVYDKIWRHKSTLDEVRDEKLRSKTASLALVGIGLRDLGIELDPASTKSIEDIQESLTPASDDLAKMNEEHYPLGKLQHLNNAHKAIVDTLSSMHSSSSSADEILPTLIYTLITSPIEGINIISNLYFIQRFRAANKIDGEAAYCLTNLEAAISFLENVDLATLRDETAEDSSRTPEQTEISILDTSEPFPKLSETIIPPSATTVSSTSSTAYATTADSPHPTSRTASGELLVAMPSQRHQRTLSDILQPPAKAISNANDAVRSTAEEGFKTISSTLDNSFKFLFGKLRERGTEDDNAELILPKTLDEARLLVSRPLTPDGDEVGISEASSLAERDGDNSSNLSKTEDKILSLFGGRRNFSGNARERSVDSSKSNGSGKKVIFAATGSSTELNMTSSQPKLQQSSNQPNNPLESVKNFGNSINPINHIGSAFGGAFRTFGSRNQVPSATPSPIAASVVSTTEDKNKDQQLLLREPTDHELAAIQAEPPLVRFMEVENIGNMKINDLQLLLKDYQRLAGILEGLSVDKT